MHDLTALSNRLKKTFKARKPWAARLGTEAYRLYEGDIPELRYIVDVYRDQAVVYDKRLASAPEDPAHDQELVTRVAEALGLPLDHIHLKRRRRVADRDDQYTRLEQRSVTLVVAEETSRYKVNLSDYLDTGLFLDHRPLRREFRRLPAGTRFLNLFCYTGAVSVAAAQAGALTTSVDLSATYLDWAKENFRLSGLTPDDHVFTQADARAYLAAGPRTGDRYDVIFLDPPTFSNSKRMAGTFDVQRDHRTLIAQAAAFLAPQGVLWFSTNHSKFQLDPKVGQDFALEDRTAATIPEDFKNRLIHRCYRITRRPAGS